MYSIQVDGCLYDVEIQEDDTIEIVTVFDSEDVEVGTVVINNSNEIAGVVYNGDPSTMSSCNYYDISFGLEGRMELARWIVSTHPING